MNPQDVLSWRSEIIDGVNTMVEIRLNELIANTKLRQVRVARPNGYELWRQDANGGWYLHDKNEMWHEDWERLTADVWALWPNTRALLFRHHLALEIATDNAGLAERLRL